MSPARERAGSWMAQAARLSFAALLFCSPSMWQWLDIERRQPPVFSGYTDFFLYPSDLFLVLTIVFGLLAPVVLGKKFNLGPWYLTFPLVALVILSFLSAITGVAPVLTLYHATRFLLYLALYFVIINIPLDAKWVAIPLALAVVVQGSVAILQYLKQSSLGLQFVGELHLDRMATGTSILRYDEIRILRAYGLTDHPNLLGGFLAFALIFVLGYYLDSTVGRIRYLLLAALAIGAVALFYTYSRAAELSLGIGVVVMLAALWRKQAQRFFLLRRVGIAVAVIILALILPAWTNQRLIAQRVGQGNSFSDNVGEARSLNERDELTESANRIFYQRQLLGVGNGALALGMYYLDPAFPAKAYDYQPAHFVILVAAAELGLLGAFLVAWLMFVPLVVLWVRRAYLTDPWLAAIAGVFVVMLLVGFFDYYPWFWQSGRLWQWSTWGLFAAVFAVPHINRFPAEHLEV